MEEYLVVDGYNIINAWPHLRRIASYSLEDARIKLIDTLRDYQGYKGIDVIIVFDAHMTESSLNYVEKYDKVRIVYTKKNETADHYIERWVSKNGKDREVWVATSDFLEQTMIMARGGNRMSARDLWNEIQRCHKKRSKKYIQVRDYGTNTLENRINSNIRIKLETLKKKR